MKKGVEKIYNRMWSKSPHPYRILEETIDQEVTAGKTILEHGCGYTAPLLRTYLNRNATLVGVDVVPFDQSEEGLRLINADIGQLPIEDNTFDLVFSRSVMEHVTDPSRVYRETFRVLKPGGKWVFLTANRWDYVSVAARVIPNRLHGKFVSHTEGREERDVFPTAYLSNSYPQVSKLANAAGFQVERFDYFGQHPSYFQFNTLLYGLASFYEKAIIAVPFCRFVRGWLLVVLKKPQ